MNIHLSLLLVCMVSVTVANVIRPETHNEVLYHANNNMLDHHTYGVYFTNADEGFFASVANFFTSDKEAEFKDMLLDTNTISLLHLNVENPEFANMAQQMGITDLPYVIVYFNGDRDHNIHGPANPETADQIITEMERIAPRPVSFDLAAPGPVGTNGQPLQQRPSPAG